MNLIQAALDKLTDNYQKAKDSRVGKMFQLIFSELEAVKNTFHKIEEWQDIDKAQGVPLDDLAKRVREERGQKEDELFRDFIKMRIRLNRSAGEIETINEVGRVFLGDAYVGVEEVWYKSELDHEPAALLISFQQTDRPVNMLAIERIKGGGVKVYWQFVLQPVEIKIATYSDVITYPYWLCGTFACGVKPYRAFDGISLDTDVTLFTDSIINGNYYPVTGRYLAGGNSFVGEV